VTQGFVLATGNPDKAEEVAAILSEAIPGLELSSRPGSIEDVEETGDTLEDNARLKALAIVEATGQVAIADDTGLEVDALGGAPGVYSSRYAGENATYADNVAKLLAALEGTPKSARTARFRTVALARFPDGSEIVTDGVVAGTIADNSRGDRGFGYDPVFEPDGGNGKTFAELLPAEKHALSHRGRAFRALAQALKDA
jgi:XTP/dITP diphosphohydrolase